MPILFFFKLFSLVNKEERFKVLLCIINNSIKHQLFILRQLNVKKKVIFQTTQFSISVPLISIWSIYMT